MANKSQCCCDCGCGYQTTNVVKICSYCRQGDHDRAPKDDGSVSGVPKPVITETAHLQLLGIVRRTIRHAMREGGVEDLAKKVDELNEKVEKSQDREAWTRFFSAVSLRGTVGEEETEQNVALADRMLEAYKKRWGP